MRLISFLGTGNYQETSYRWIDQRQEFTSRYVVRALAEFVGADEVVVLATAEAENRHAGPLKEAFLDYRTVPRIRRIPDGRDQDELWQQFDALQELLDVDCERGVALDITHGFRSQPFFAAAVIALHLASGEPRSLAAYYGEFNDSSGISRIWSLTAFVELLRWSHAVGVFARTGFAGDLIRVLKQADTDARGRAREGGGGVPRTGGFINALRALADDLATVRVAATITGYKQDDRQKQAAVGSAQRLLQELESYRGEIESRYRPLLGLLDDLSRDLGGLPSDSLGGQQGQDAMIALARLYLRWERYPEAAIVAREAAVSQYAQSDAAVEVNTGSFDPEARSGAEQLWWQADGDEARTVAGVRNDLQHGGFGKQPLSGPRLKEQVREMVERVAADREPEVGLPPGRIWFVSRHPGALEWARAEGIEVDRAVDHLEMEDVMRGDTVIGSLPVNLAAAVCERGARYLHLSLELPQALRGRELTMQQLRDCGARVREFHISSMEQA